VNHTSDAQWVRSFYHTIDQSDILIFRDLLAGLPNFLLDPHFPLILYSFKPNPHSPPGA
jgi:hypothetical protein